MQCVENVKWAELILRNLQTRSTHNSTKGVKREMQKRFMLDFNWIYLIYLLPFIHLLKRWTMVMTLEVKHSAKRNQQSPHLFRSPQQRPVKMWRKPVANDHLDNTEERTCEHSELSAQCNKCQNALEKESSRREEENCNTSDDENAEGNLRTCKLVATYLLCEIVVPC